MKQRCAPLADERCMEAVKHPGRRKPGERRRLHLAHVGQRGCKGLRVHQPFGLNEPEGDVENDNGENTHQYDDTAQAVRGQGDDGDHYAASLHMVNKWNNFTLASQITKYKFDIDTYSPDTTGTPADNLIQFGAFDFPNVVATEGWIPAISLSYYHATPSIPWLDYVVPYIEYSSILKEDSDFNDSDLATLGAAWGSGGWYIYTEVAYSSGNEFVGGENPFGNRLGANPDDDRQYRANINLGYYF